MGSGGDFNQGLLQYFVHCWPYSISRQVLFHEDFTLGDYTFCMCVCTERQ